MLTERQYSNHKAYVMKIKKSGWYEYLAGLSHAYKPKQNSTDAHDKMLLLSAEYRAGYEYRPRGPGRPKLPKKPIIAGEKRPVGRPRVNENPRRATIRIPYELHLQLQGHAKTLGHPLRSMITDALELYMAPAV